MHEPLQSHLFPSRDGNQNGASRVDSAEKERLAHRRFRLGAVSSRSGEYSSSGPDKKGAAGRGLPLEITMA